ncbi:family 16 glycoside hydrolase [Sphingobacterium bovistauri]|uniref:DUF1080 domain-containing protein n=1 Tax=Sphingobacterium bovistauri TaxID=2781959 RepID=A0ABS7Z345_9SPHI|nr:family 16 glycoside hydrolase [Sphingobacterium bovistauri]MCA5004398.1 DUF1080 domain-containing protein [Sphingobacterium bovistauri]
MKKIFNTISILLLLQTASYAQQPAGRTAETKIADVLAQQPAAEQGKFLLAMGELENFTSEDVAQLLSKLRPQGQDNATIEYATNSYAFYVMQSGKEAVREKYVKGILLALDKLKDKDNKGYALELLKFCAKNEAIEKVSSYLTDEYLAEKAARVLSAIHTKESSSALNKALAGNVTEKTATAIIGALGEVKNSEAEDRILELIKTYQSDNFQRNAYSALSKLGTAKSYDTLYAKAKSVDLGFDRTNVAALLLEYANNLAKNGDSKLATSIASRVYTEASADKGIGAKVAALELLGRLDPKKQRKNLLKLTNDNNAVLRNVALGLLSKGTSASEMKKIASSLVKLNPEAQESVLNFLKTKDASASIKVLEKGLPKIKTEESRIAAYNTLSALTKGGNTAFVVKQLSSASDKELATLKALLLTSKDSNTINVVNSLLATTDEKSQLALLDVLSKRSNENSSAEIFKLINSGSPAVRSAAFVALPNVVKDSDFDTIAELLGKASDSEVKLAQQAAIVALQNNTAKESIVKKLSANISRSLAPSSVRYFPVFAGEGSVEALQTVKNYIGKDNPLRAEAIKSLASWSNPSSLDALTELLRTEKEPSIFSTVFDGFVKQLNASSVNNDQKTILLKDAFAFAQNNKQKNTALGSLKSTNTYSALAFASKYLNDKDLKGVATDVVMNIASDNKDFIGKDVRNWLESAMNNLSGSESSYLREAIVRHLAEMPKGESFVSMFNGKDLTGWKGLVENPIKRAQMSAKELASKQVEADKAMNNTWAAEDGSLVFSGHGQNIATQKQYADFELILDWKLDKNGKEPDAGVYLRGTPQVQMWDISRTNVGAQVGSGGLYNNQKNESKPSKVADNPLGEWNNMKIRMVGEKVWVWLNGEKVVDNVTLENFWDRSQPIFPIEQIELQAHGSRVWYRDIYIKEIPRKVTFTLNEQEKKEGFEMLFDGKNLNKWTESPAYEIDSEGSLRSNPDAKFGKNIYTKEQYGDFVYRFEFKLTPGANNGVGIRTPIEGDAAYLGHEIQVLDDDADVYKNLKPYQYHGSVYGIIASKRGALKPMGEWNQQEIRVQGSKIKVTLNGKVIVDGDIKEASKNGTADKKDHPGLKQTKGHIGFLGHGTEVFFRNIRVKQL